ncbi:MAG: hypothetical protein ABI068_11875 [Ktedonobacterales bacterium]
MISDEIEKVESKPNRSPHWDDALTPVSADDGRALAIRCPFCHSRDVEPLALFGSQLLTDQYYCRACRTPFEHVRDTDR